MAERIAEKRTRLQDVEIEIEKADKTELGEMEEGLAEVEYDLEEPEDKLEKAGEKTEKTKKLHE